MRLGEVETVEYQRDRGMGVTVYFGKRKGSASTADLSARAVAETVEKACDIARYTAEDECAGLADPDELARDIPDLDLDHPWDLPPEQAVETGARLRGRGTRRRRAHHQFRGRDRRQPPGRARVRQFARLPRGLSVHQPQRELRAARADRRRHAARLLVQLGARCARPGDRAEIIGRKAGERAVARLGARKIATQKARVLYAPEVARGLIGHFLGAVRGSSQYRKSSFLLGAAGQQVFPSISSNCASDRTSARAWAAVRSMAKASRRATASWCSDGVLQGYVLGSYSARKLGLKTTGNAGGTHNLLVESKNGGLDIDALMRELGTGLLVTELMGQGVNGVTGDYSRGASGYWVENGVQAYPVHEITIAGNLKDMYRNIAALGNDVDVRGGVRVGSILISEMTIAGE